MAFRALLYRRPTEPRTLAVKIGSSTYTIQLRRHRRARRYTLRIHPSRREAILTMPPRGNLYEAKDFAQRHGAWIAARLGGLPKAAPFSHGTSVPLRGVPHKIVHRAGVRGTVWTEMRESGDKILCVAGDSEFIDRRVHDFLKREARRALTDASHRYADVLGVKVKRITIRDQSSRWGFAFRKQRLYRNSIPPRSWCGKARCRSAPISPEKRTQGSFSGRWNR